MCCCIAPTDYIATTQVLTFGPEVTQFTVAIPITEEDDIVESVEQFFARLVLTDSDTDIDVELSPAETAIQITDNDGKSISFMNSTDPIKSLLLVILVI